MVASAYSVRVGLCGNDYGRRRFWSCVVNGSWRVGCVERAAADVTGPHESQLVIGESSGPLVERVVCVAALHIEDVCGESDLLASLDGCADDLRFDTGNYGEAWIRTICRGVLESSETSCSVAPGRGSAAE